MKQVIYNRYGGFDELEMAPRAGLAPAGDQVLIDVKAVAINPLDWKILEGQMKMMTGSRFPRGIGIEFAGIVAAVGGGVAGFKPGDAVFGMLDAFKGGALAEQVVASQAQIHAMPANLSFAQAAALPISGTSALQILDDLAPVRQGSEILINGAVGGVGSLLTQIAKRRGAIVTAVVSGRGVDLAKRLHSDVVLDYGRDDLRGLNKRFDVVIDLSDKLAFGAAKALMKPRSVYVNTLPDPKSMAAAFINNLLSAQKRKILMMKATQDRLASLHTIASDWMEVVVGKTFPMAEFKAAYAEVKALGTLGKAVIIVG
jgi:NADPH:quinone reductase-like Zn-dependent oxidoreductase